MTTTTTTVPCDYTSVAICMNAQRDRLTAELTRVGMEADVHVMGVERDVDDGVRGCFESHQRALMYALAQRSDGPILVLEDDVVFAKGRDAIANALGDARLALEEGVLDIVAIGGLATRPFARLARHPSVFRTSFQTTHAYAISRKAAKIIVHTPFEQKGRFLRIGDHYDHVLSNVLTQGIVYPTVAFQDVREDLTTTNSNSVVYRVLVQARDVFTQRLVQEFLAWLMFTLGYVFGTIGTAAAPSNPAT